MHSHNLSLVYGNLLVNAYSYSKIEPKLLEDVLHFFEVFFFFSSEIQKQDLVEKVNLISLVN